MNFFQSLNDLTIITQLYKQELKNSVSNDFSYNYRIKKIFF